jgi:hypothetical protein
MAYDLDLDGSRAKLKRAQAHIDAFHTAVEEKLGAHPINYGIGRQVDRDQSAVIYRINRLIEIDDGWSPIIGDAVHNLRCALDHLAWQLAIRHCNGVEPKNPNSIYFPITASLHPIPRVCNAHHRRSLPQDLQCFVSGMKKVS